MTILLFWTAVGAFVAAFTYRRAYGRLPVIITRNSLSLHSSSTEEFAPPTARELWGFRIAFWVGIGMFSIFGSLAALAKDMG